MTSKMTRRSLCVFLLLFTVAAVMAGCGDKAAEQGQSGKVIRVGYFPNITHSQALLGLGDGTFQKALGSEVRIIEHTFNAGPAEIEALLAGEIDIGYIGPVPAINGFVRSEGELKIVAGAADAGAVLVARKDAGIQDVKGINGKKVAIPQLGNTQDISLRNLMAEAGLRDAAKGDTVSVIPVENPDILTLISKGEIDAALVPEPWGSRLVKQANATVILEANQVWREGKYTTAVVIVSSKFLKEQPELVEKWLAAHVEITERINRDLQNSQVVINNQIKKLTQKSLPEDIVRSSFQRIVVTYNPEADSVREFLRLSVDNGYIKGDPDISGLFDFNLLNKVLQRKGLQPLQ